MPAGIAIVPSRQVTRSQPTKARYSSIAFCSGTRRPPSNFHTCRSTPEVTSKSPAEISQQVAA